MIQLTYQTRLASRISDCGFLSDFGIRFVLLKSNAKWLQFLHQGNKGNEVRRHLNSRVPTFAYLRCLRFLLFKGDASFGSGHPGRISDFSTP